METTLTHFRRNFRVVRAAAERGEMVKVKSGAAVYVFARITKKRGRPWSDLERLFGVARRFRDLTPPPAPENLTPGLP